MFSSRGPDVSLRQQEDQVVIHLSILLLSVEILCFHVLMGNVVKYIINMP